MTGANPGLRLYEALRLLPDLSTEGEDVELLRSGGLSEAIGVLSETAEMLRWGVLAAHSATLTSGRLRSARWPLDERRVVNPVRLSLRAALEPTYVAAMSLHDAARHAQTMFVRSA